MKDRRTLPPWPVVAASLILLVLTGCTARKPFTYRTFLLPPGAQLSDGTLVSSVPPSVEPSYYTHETPTFMDGRRLPEPSTAEPLIRRAEARFQEGRRLFRAGQMDEAREQFDRAIDILLAGTVTGPGRADIDKKLSELADAIHQYEISGLRPGEPDTEPAYEQSPLDEIPELTFPIDPKLRGQVAEQLKTTVSQLPLELNDDVLRYVNYFSTGRGRKTFIFGTSRAGRYRNMIRRIFDEEGVPQELIHLAQAESGFAPRAVSRKKATGMWQFMQFRGREYGLLQTKTTDDRLDPEKATRAAARHLKDLYNQFGDWYLAVCGYNCGPLCVERAVERAGYADVWELRRRGTLPKETTSYLPIILAMAIIGKNPSQYGIELIEPAPYLEYSTIEMDAPAHLALVGDIIDRPAAELRDMNPALLTNVVPARYPLHVPVGTGPAVLSALQLVPENRRTAWRLHRVAEDDTLAGVARIYKSTPQQIAAANPAAAELPEAGSFLIVPAPEQIKRSAAATRTAARRPATKPTSTTAQKQPAKQAPLAAAKKQPAKKKAPVAAAKKQPAKSSGTAVASAKRRSSTVAR